MADNVEYGLLARYQFLGQQGTTQMGRTSRAFQGLHKNAKLAQQGVRQAGQGLRTLSMFGIGAVAVVGSFVKKSAKFNQQMSVVQSVTNVTGKRFSDLRSKALALGASTSFTSKQAAEGMEHLARASLTSKQIIAAIGPTLRMAEADSLDLGTASQIVAASLKQFGLEAKRTTSVADIFAYVSANSNTNITGLGEGLKFAGVAAKGAGQSFEDTVGALGLLANVGLKGTLGGTALKNSIVKLTKQTPAAVKLFGGKAGLNKVLTNTDGTMRRLPNIINDVVQKLSKVKNQADRTKIAFEIFGIRGKAAMDAFAAHKLKDQARLLDNLGQKAEGTASRMAKQRLDNLAGDWTLFKSALDNVAISIGSMLEPEIRKLFKGSGGLIMRFQKVGQAVNMMNAGFSETAVAQKYGKTVAGIAFGIKEAFQEVKSTIKSTVKMLGAIFKRMTGGKELNAKKITKYVAKFVMFAAILAPIAAGLTAVGIAGGAMFQVLGGGFKMLRALTSGWGIALMALVYVLSGTKKKGETTFEHMARGVKKLTKLVYALTAPFRLLAKHLGALPAILAAVGAYKVGKYALGKAGSFLAGSKNPLARMMGGAMGAAGRQGMPVYVTNFAEAPGGGIGGGLPGMGGAAAGAAGKAGIMARLGYVAKGLGMSIPGLLGGGKLVMGGTAATAGTAGKTAAMAASAGTATAALGAFTLAIAPAIAGVREMGKAYDPAFQARYRDKMLSGYRAKMAAARKKQETEDSKRAKLGLGPKFMSLDYMKNETWEQQRRRKLIGKTGVHMGHSRSFQSAYKSAKTGDVWDAVRKMADFGYGKFQGKVGGMTDYELKTMGMNREMVNTLIAISKANDEQIMRLNEGRTINVVVDGKVIAVASSKVKEGSKRRAGKSAGASRVNLERRGY